MKMTGVWLSVLRLWVVSSHHQTGFPSASSQRTLLQLVSYLTDSTWQSPILILLFLNTSSLLKAAKLVYYSQLACPVVTVGVLEFVQCACVSVHVCVCVGWHVCVCFYFCPTCMLCCTCSTASYVSLQWLAFLLFLEIVPAITAVSYVSYFINSVCFFLLTSNFHKEN